MEKSTAQRALVLACSFEAEVFVRLLLEKWNHPLSDDGNFRNDLLEAATLAIQASCANQILLEPLKPQDFNFIAAIWYAEWTALQDDEDQLPFRESRQQWLDNFRRALPSCFCDPADLA